MHFCKKRKEEGKSKGGIILGKRKEWGGEKGIKIEQIKEEGVIVSRIKEGRGKEDVVIISIYNSGNWKAIENAIKEIFEINRKDNIIVGGDFNIRIEEEGGWDEQIGEYNRKSKDKVIGLRARKLIDLVSEVGGRILNRASEGDSEGEYTYVGARGSSVIDYIFVNEVGYNIVNSFKVSERVESDHMPLIVELRIENTNGEERREKEELIMKIR